MADAKDANCVLVDTIKDPISIARDRK